MRGCGGGGGGDPSFLRGGGKITGSLWVSCCGEIVG